MATAAGALGLGMFAADELPLDQELPVDRFERADVDVDQLAGELALLVQLSMRPRRILPISARSVSVAREMNGKSARLRARRMRLLMTMSDSGPGAAQPFAAGLGQLLQIDVGEVHVVK